MKFNRSYIQQIDSLIESLRTVYFARVLVVVTLVVFAYMWQWHAMPLFPDEVAFMTRNARFFSEGGFLYGRFAVCPSSMNAIPGIFYPAAIFVTEINSMPYWSMVRVLPYLSIAALVAALLVICWKSERSIGAALLIPAGFVGVVGSGLVMSRPEIYLIFQGAACLIAYSYLSNGHIPKKIALLLLVLLGVVSNISIFVHPQGLLYAPLALLLMYRISGAFEKLGERISISLSTLYLGLSVWAGYKLTQFFKCSENQQITDFIHSMVVPGWLQSSGANQVSGRLKDEFFVRFGYFDKFEFASRFQIDYLPPTSLNGSALDVLIRPLNFSISVLTAIVMLAFISLCFYLLVTVCIKLYGLKRDSKPWPNKLMTFGTSNEVMFFTICWAHLGLLLIVTQINFYRAFYLNLAMVVLLILAIHQTKRRSVRNVAIVLGIVSLLTCFMSAIIANQYFNNPLKAGYAGPSIPLAVDWKKIETDVQNLKNVCGIQNEDPRIVVDDMTYDSLKGHRRILPITYIGMSSEIIDVPVKDIISDIKATATVTRCDYFNAYSLPYSARVGSLCCAKY